MTDTGLNYIKEMFKVPANMNARVSHTDSSNVTRYGNITGAAGSMILIKFDGQENSIAYHPTHGIQYL